MQSKVVLDVLAAHPEGSFVDLFPFNESTVGACRITGESPVWEMHPDTDEMFFVIDGALSITLLLENESPTVDVSPGAVFVVPKGVWHKPKAPNGVQFLYFTPGRSLHCDAEDPRIQTAT